MSGAGWAIVLRQVKHLTALVDDLVDVSRVTQGLVDIEKVPLDLAPVVDSAIEQVRSFIESRQQQLRVHVAPDPVFVLGDHKRLVQIVTNLLGNATKYTPPGGAIDIKVTATVDTITLSVEDNGIGMATELQSRVFELFTQAKRTSDRSQRPGYRHGAGEKPDRNARRGDQLFQQWGRRWQPLHGDAAETSAVER
nr:HAMP domain-containing sensor histidine kinase [Duganella sp. FT27W]